jgi:post-segregation antitoxin (ccd killing protein)
MWLGLNVMVSSDYLRRQAALLVSMSRATIDLGIAARLRAMATDLQEKATEQEQAQMDEPKVRVA